MDGSLKCQLDYLSFHHRRLDFSATQFGWAGLGWSLVGTFVGLALLLPAYAVGGMGAGDVKLLAASVLGFGNHHVLRICFSAIAGGVIAVLLVLWNRSWRRHFLQFQAIVRSFLSSES